MKIFGYAVRPDVAHWLILAAATFGGGVEGYLQQQSPTSLLQALTSWPTLRVIVLHAALAGCLAVVAMARRSFLQWTGSVSGGGSAPAPAATAGLQVAVPAAPPPPPVVTRRAAKRVLGLALASFAVGLLVLSLGALVGCSSLKAPNGPQAVATIEQDIAYVQSFETGAKDVWAVVEPLLGSSAATANTYFQNAIASLDQAVVVAQDAAAGYQAVTGDAGPNLPAAFTALQSAVAAVIDVIDVWRGQADAGVGASPNDSLHHQAGVIAGWRVPAS